MRQGCKEVRVRQGVHVQVCNALQVVPMFAHPQGAVNPTPRLHRSIGQNQERKPVQGAKVPPRSRWSYLDQRPLEYLRLSAFLHRLSLLATVPNRPQLRFVVGPGVQQGQKKRRVPDCHHTRVLHRGES